MLGLGADRDFPTVLLIDDDLISREVIATILTLNGYTLHTAEGGTQAVELLDAQACSPQVILVDVQMPGLNGLDLVRALRARSKAGVYAISGSEPPQALREAVDGFLLKPFTPEALQKLLDAHKSAGGAPTAPESDDLPVIDPVTLRQLREMMPEATVREVYEAVVNDLHKRIAALREAIARRDVTEVRRIGHTIKGGCGMAGVRQASRIGSLLEAESNELSNSEYLSLELGQALERLERMLGVEFPA